MIQTCSSCKQIKSATVPAVIAGIYYKHVCSSCLGANADEITSSAAGYERRRGYEDNAQDTIQPYDAHGPNAEFARLYPQQAKKVFKPEVLEDLKRKI